MAFEEEQILALVNRTVALAKPFINKDSKKRDGQIGKVKGKWPEYYPGYNEKVEDFESILVHSKEGVFPEKLFAESAPNQEPKEFEYVKRNYRNTTLPIFVDYISTVSRPFHKSNWSIKYTDDERIFKDHTLQHYLENEIPIYFSLENFMKNVVPSLKARDAEGVIAVKPVDIQTIEKDGERVISPTELITPIPVYYNVWQRVTEANDHVMVLLKEKSIVTEGNRKLKQGFIYEFYDEDRIWHITQVGKRTDYTFVAEIFFDHEWGEVPVYKLMGIPTVQDDMLTWQSPFLFAVDNLDLVVIYQSDLQSSIKKCAYPYRIMIGDICEFTDEDGNICDNGRITFNDKDGNQINRVCSDCNGSGLKSRVSRLGEMLLKPEGMTDKGEMDMKVKPMEYVSPEVDTLEFMRSEINEHENRGRRILHLNTTNDMAQPRDADATATAMAIDLKSLAAFVAPISDQYFFLYDNVLDAMGWMRYGKDYKEPELNAPITFDFSTEDDYVERIAMATKAGVPPIVIRAILMQFIQTIFVNNEKQEKVFRLVTAADRLLAISSDEIAMKIARGTAAPFEDVIHCSSITLIDELIAGDDKFLDKKIEEQVTELQTLAKTKVVDSTESIVEDIVT